MFVETQSYPRAPYVYENMVLGKVGLDHVTLTACLPVALQPWEAQSLCASTAVGPPGGKRSVVSGDRSWRPVVISCGHDRDNNSYIYIYFVFSDTVKKVLPYL